MLRATLAIVILGLGICHASPVPETTNVNGCVYELFREAVWVTKPIEPQQYGYYSNHAKSLEECTELCQKHPNCTTAQYTPDVSKGPTCQAAIQLGFSKQPVKSAKNPHNKVVRLVPNSCDKPVATPTPVGCKPGKRTDKDGCVYNVTCNEQMDHLNYASIISLASADECYEQVKNRKGAFGYTFYQGGDCRVNIFHPGLEKMIHAKTSKRAHTETAQVVKGSCSKAM